MLCCYKRKLVLDPTSSLVRQVLLECHSTLMGGHGGIQKTTAKVCAAFTWPGVKKDVKKFVQECMVCQQMKCENRRPAGLLQPLLIPDKMWEELSMDFVTSLPNSHSYITILVVVDRLSKQAYFGALPKTYSAARVAELFYQMVYKLHGIPRSIVFNRDTIFLSSFWRELFALSGTILHRSTAYHPQTDRQLEVVNRVLQQYLRCFVIEHLRRWFKVLHWAEYCYNISFHSSLSMSPFKAVNGRKPPFILD